MTWLGPEFGKYGVFVAYALMLVCGGLLMGMSARRLRVIYLARRFK